MVPSHCIDLSSAQRQRLLGIARDSIDAGLASGRGLQLAEESLEQALTARRGVFVTLKAQGKLRGCIGSMQTSKPLGISVADNAYGAAFRDPRFPGLAAEEFPTIAIEISVLSRMETLQITDRESLLASLRPGIDGLLLEDGQHRATFLPQVWEQLPHPGQFLDQLLHKAGLASDHWSETLACQRYQVTSFTDKG